MKRKPAYSFICIVTALCVLTAGIASGGALTAQADEYEAASVSEITDLEEAKAYLEATLSDLDSQLESLSQELAQLSEQSGDVYDRLVAAEEALAEAKAAEEEQYESMKKRIQYLYENQGAGFLALIFEDESLESILNKVQYANDITEYDRAMLLEYQETKELIAAYQAELQQESNDLSELIAESEQKRDEILELIAATALDIEALSANIDGAEEELAQYRAALQAAELAAEEEIDAVLSAQSEMETAIEAAAEETAVLTASAEEADETASSAETYTAAEETTAAVQTTTEAETVTEAETTAAEAETTAQETTAQTTAAEDETAAEEETTSEAQTEALDSTEAEEDEEDEEDSEDDEEDEEDEEEFDYTVYSDLELMAAMIHREADGEPWEGKVAVGNVIMNRIASSRYPDTMLGVLSQAYQFSPWGTEKYKSALVNGVDAECWAAAEAAYYGTEDYVDGLLHFRTASSGYSGLIIGNHVFY